ncbi:Down syndrome cell adhesion molecule-like protein Dscam2 [Araneus ventricosus]|uniref:Down syndrome cell adhesion molecule-like protein Dscam2 n=1 Tax=Araneus ventricosus TaxID=182803 RepID=A0A4Y2I4X0_ARAVE|nr:Down syndrome cell adhesion molecule-like protein Dscam2 [Araneus ventricosus]
MKFESTAGDFTYVHSSPRAHRYNNGTLVLSDVEESDSGSYLCQASNGIGAGLSKIITLKVLVPPRFKDQYQTKTVVEGLDINVSCSAVGDPPIIIKWMKNKAILDAKKNPRCKLVFHQPPPEETRNGIIKGYYVGYKMSAGEDTYTFKQVEKSANEQQSTYITGLQPFTEYDIVIKAYNSAGAGPESPQIMGKTLETAPPTSPIVQVLSTTSSSIEFKWEKDAKDKSAITEYMLHYKSDNGDWEQLRLSNKQDHYSLDGLKCGTRYHMYMTASNSLGTGEPSEQVTARTLGAAPMSPHESSFLQPNTTSVTLNLGAWQSGGCPIRHFVVQYRPKYLNAWTTLTDKLDMPRDTYVIRSLSPDRDYVVLVTAHSEAGLTQAEYLVRTLPVSPIVPTSSPAFGKRETDLPFYKNVTLVIPIVVSSLVLVIVIFIVVVCLRKHSEDRDGRIDYENRKDALMMKDLNKQINIKPAKPSHYSCPTGNKGDYAEPYTCIDSVSTRQASDGLFATIKRCPTRPVYMPGSYNKGTNSSQGGSFSCHPVGGAPNQKIPNSESTEHPDSAADKWSGNNQANISHKPVR